MNTSNPIQSNISEKELDNLYHTVFKHTKCKQTIYKMKDIELKHLPPMFPNDHSQLSNTRECQRLTIGDYVVDYLKHYGNFILTRSSNTPRETMIHRIKEEYNKSPTLWTKEMEMNANYTSKLMTPF